MNMTVTATAEARAQINKAPSISTPSVGHPKLMSVADAKAMSVGDMRETFASHINPGQLHLMKLLGFDKIKVERAEGMYYYDQNGRKMSIPPPLKL